MKKYGKTKLEGLTSSSYFKEKQLPISRMKHHLGQNFLRSKDLAVELAALSKVNNKSFVFEIGTGAGEFTEALLKKGASLISCEIDKDLFDYLDEKFLQYSKNKQLLLLFEDASKLNFEQIYNYYLSIRHNGVCTMTGYHTDTLSGSEVLSAVNKEINCSVDCKIADFTNGLSGRVDKFRVCANLPYYLTRDFLYKMFVELNQADSFALMLQKEAAERLMTSLPGQQNYRRDLYGPLAIFREFYGEAKVVRKMRRSDFIPSPRVDSYFVLVEKKYNEYNVNIGDIHKLIFASFKQRRKTLIYNLNNIDFNGKILKKDFLEDLFETLSFKKSIRAEELRPIDFVKLYEKLKKPDN